MKFEKPILVTKSYLPPLEEYQEYLQKLWSSAYLTNGGPLAKELEAKLEELLDVKHVLFTSNGTIALQLVIKAMELKGEIITTPYTYVATTSSIIWENCIPVFADIDKKTLCLDPAKVEALITKKTVAIMPVHVYGIPCDVKAFDKLSQKYNIPVIYDAAHSFSTAVDGISVFKYGTVSTLSFHATKLFHTVEGGAILTNNDALAKKLELMRSFGHIGDEHFCLGINGKSSEFHAAMGLANLPHLPEIIDQRQALCQLYDTLLDDLITQKLLTRPTVSKRVTYNYAYYPVVFKTAKIMHQVLTHLNAANVLPRRYFTPSLNKLPYVQGEACPISESVADRVLCLPLYFDLQFEEVRAICDIIHEALVADYPWPNQKHKKRPTVTIGIPAFNEAQNIAHLLQSILKQKDTNYKLNKILVVCDGSTDKTPQVANKVAKNDPRIQVFNDRQRLGKANRLNQIYSLNKSDLLFTLDGDVLLDTPNEIAKLVSIFLEHPEAQVVAAHQVPVLPKSFIGRIVYANNLLWNQTRVSVNGGDHIANLFGSATMLRKSFSQSFTYPSQITCDEEFLYIMAKKHQGFRYSKDSRVLYQPASSIKEIKLQGSRFRSERYRLVQYFGSDVLLLHDIPRSYKSRALAIRLLKDPFYTILAVLLNEFISFFPSEDKLNEVGMWETARSTKVVIN